MSFLHRHSAKDPLSEDRMMRILKASHCTVRYRFESVFAVDRANQEYHVCRTVNLESMTVQGFSAALTRAFSFRVRSS